MLVKIHNAHDRIRSSPTERYKPKHDFVIPPPKGETLHNRHARIRQIGVSRTGVGIAGRKKLIGGKKP